MPKIHGLSKAPSFPLGSPSLAPKSDCVTIKAWSHFFSFYIGALLPPLGYYMILFGRFSAAFWSSFFDWIRLVLSPILPLPALDLSHESYPPLNSFYRYILVGQEVVPDLSFVVRPANFFPCPRLFERSVPFRCPFRYYARLLHLTFQG